MKINLIIIIILISLTGIIMAADFTPQGNINLRGVYGILNVTNISFLDGTQMLTAYNSSWNQTGADLLYAGIEWDYNQTEALNVNTTQMTFSNGRLDILESWFTTLWNTIFGTKTTDDLTEGSTNKYDNKTWNETRGNELYADISIVSNPFDQDLNTTDTPSFTGLNSEGGNFTFDSDGNNFYTIFRGETASPDNQELRIGVNDNNAIFDYFQDSDEGSAHSILWDFVGGGMDLDLFNYIWKSDGVSQFTLDRAGGLFLNNVSADFFLGDGSQLTNLPSGDNSSWNQSFADTLYADISVTGDNSSWNQSRADELYAEIQWGYNQTLGVDQSYVEGLGFVTGIHTIIWDTLFNNTLTDFVNTWFGTQTTDDLAEGSTNKYEDGNTFNSTYDAKVTDNETWSESLASTLYADIGIDGTLTSVSAGNGMDFSTITSTGAITLGTPSSLTAGTSNAVTSTSHTHSVSGFLETLVQDTSPQLGGYLDTNTEDIGSTTDEIENIYIGTNVRIWFGNGQESSMYFNGTDLVTEVS